MSDGLVVIRGGQAHRSVFSRGTGDFLIQQIKFFCPYPSISNFHWNLKTSELIYSGETNGGFGVSYCSIGL